MASPEGVIYQYENVGLIFTSVPDASITQYENVGREPTSNRDGVGYEYAYFLDTRPPNDDFANAFNLGSGVSGSTSGYDVGGTTEVGEPASTGGVTVWWYWTAPSTIPSVDGITFSTAGSSPDPQQISIFTGSAVNALTLVALGVGTVTFAPTPGTRYYVRIDAVDPSSYGTIALSWEAITAAINTFVAVYTGNTIDTLTLLGANDDGGFDPLGADRHAAKVRFTPEPGVTYIFQVGGIGDVDEGILHVNLTHIPP